MRRRSTVVPKIADWRRADKTTPTPFKILNAMYLLDLYWTYGTHHQAKTCLEVWAALDKILNKSK
jgi:hypothetical protein